MIKDITIGQYFNGKSVIHSLDPRMKISLMVFSIVAIFLCNNFFSLALAALFTLVVSLLSRVPMKMMLRSLRPIVVVLIFTAILNVFFTKGGDVVLLEFWRIKITDKGVKDAIFIAVRIICLVVLGSLLSYTTTPTTLTDAIERLLSPLKIFKIKIQVIAMMMTLTLRFIPVLIDETDRIMNAQKARGADLESGGLFARARALLPILIPLLVSSVRRAMELAYAMECRCYTGGDNRTRMKTMKLRARDFLSLSLVCVFIAGIVLLNIYL